MKSSHSLITAICDNCQNETTKEFDEYNRITNNNTEKYYCFKCKGIKTTQTLQKEGYNNVMERQDVKEKHKENIKNNWTIETKEKLTNTKKKIIIQKHPEILSIDDELCGDQYIYNIHCNRCNNIFKIKSNLYYTRNNANKILCIICNPLDDHISRLQLEILDEIKRMYSGKIETNTRKIISKELDIYLPDLKIAFEVNGIFWHSTKYKDRNYHYNKFKECFDAGISLFYLYEDDVRNDKNKVFKYIQSKILKNDIIDLDLIKLTNGNDDILYYLNNGYKVKINIKPIMEIKKDEFNRDHEVYNSCYTIIERI